MSFYNETNGRAIYPTPVIGMLGVIEKASSSVGLAFRSEGDALVLLGTDDPGDFGGSEYAKVINGAVGGPPPGLDIDAERRLVGLLVAAVAGGLVRSAHDLSSGGLAIALAESALTGRLGFAVDVEGPEPHRALFCESPSRAVVSCSQDDLPGLLELAAGHRVAARVIGETGGPALDYGAVTCDLAAALDAWEGAFDRALSTSME